MLSEDSKRILLVSITIAAIVLMLLGAEAVGRYSLKYGAATTLEETTPSTARSSSGN